MHWSSKCLARECLRLLSETTSTTTSTAPAAEPLSARPINLFFLSVNISFVTGASRRMKNTVSRKLATGACLEPTIKTKNLSRLKSELIKLF